MSVSPVTEGCSEKYGKRLIGKTDMEDALKKLDNLTQEEARMIIAENLRATHAVDERVRRVTEQVLSVDDRVANVNDKVAEVIRGVQIIFRQSRYMFTVTLICSDGMVTKQVVKQVERSSSPNLIGIGYEALCIIIENQLRDSIHKWLSPPDPSTNHNIACGTHHKKPATWFFEGNIYREWKSKGSLLWIHGKRAPCPNFLSDTPR
jgi:hypothetical protein